MRLAKGKEKIIIINQFWKSMRKFKGCIEAEVLPIRLYFTVH